MCRLPLNFITSLLLGTAAMVATEVAAEPVRYFPLDVGTRWSYRNSETGQDLVAEIVSRDDGTAVYRVGATDVRLREENDQRVQIEIPGTGFAPYYHFDEDSWIHRDYRDCDDDRVMTVLARDASVETPAGTFQGCLDIAYDTGGCIDAGSFREWWAPGVGRVKWMEVTIAGIVAWELQSFDPGDLVTFRRGDANSGGGIDISDAVSVLGYLFLGDPAPTCIRSADMDDGGSVDISDAVYLLTYLFLGGPAPADPFQACGQDLTPDALSCQSHSPCE